MSSVAPTPEPTPTPARCLACDRILILRAGWVKLSAAQRERIAKTHARYAGHGLCARDYKYGIEASDIAYVGGWTRDRLILRPTATRPKDRDWGRPPVPQRKRAAS